MQRLFAAIHTKFPAKKPGQLTWHTGCAFNRILELGTLEIMMKAIV